MTKSTRQLHDPGQSLWIPGTPEGIPAIEEAIYRGIPINVTLADKLQKDGGVAFKKSWGSLTGGRGEKVIRLTTTSPS